jgi:hypothetical protein
MATDDSGRPGPDAGQVDGGTESPADQGGARADDRGSPDGGSSGGKPADDRPRPDRPPDEDSVGQDAEAGPLKGALGQVQLSGRRARDDNRADNLFHTDVKDENLPAVYVKPDEYGRALRALTDHRVVVLQGKPGSGRHAMARHLLRHSLEAKWINDELDPDIDFGDLKLRNKGLGYLLERYPRERAGSLRPSHLRSYGRTLETWEGYLVITVDDDVPVFSGESPDAPLVACASLPDLQLMLEKHVGLFLRDRNGLRDEDREWLRGDTVRRHLERNAELRRTVHLASYLASELTAPPTPDRYEHLAESLEAVESREERAKRQLKDYPNVEHWSFVIALAVYEGGKADVVADAAALLAQRLAPGDPRSQTAWEPGPVRAERLQQPGADGSALAERLAVGDPRSQTAWRPGPVRAERLQQAGAEWFDDHESAVMFTPSPVRRVRFKDPTMRPAVLDHIWTELDELRGPVRDWLLALGGDTNPEVREPAAEAVGYLATHGLGYILDLVIVPWVRRSRTTRDAAAFALGALARDKRFTKPVLAQLSHWARWGINDWREAAAMAYGRTIGQRKPDIALRELRALAMREGAQPPVAWALYELVRRWRHREVLEALSAWTIRPERATWSPAERRVIRTGLTAFLLTTRLFDETGLRPVLLGLAEEDPGAREWIAVLWQRALADDVVGDFAAQRLCAWAREADVQASTNGDDQPGLVPALRSLVADLADGGRANAGRVRQALNQCAHARDDPSDVARSLVDQAS